MAAATRRLYLDGSGTVVEHGDPTAVTLLVAVGQEIPAGYTEPVEPAEVKAVASAPNKAVKGAPNK